MKNTGSMPAQSGEDIGPFHIPKRMHVPSGVVRLPDQPGRNSPHLILRCSKYIQIIHS